MVTYTYQFYNTVIKMDIIDYSVTSSNLICKSSQARLVDSHRERIVKTD
jgi:hypothetical protein